MVQITDEMNTRTVSIDLTVLQLMCVAANLQLACRHPRNDGPAGKVAKDVCLQLQKEIAALYPEWEDVFQKGWFPEYDQ